MEEKKEDNFKEENPVSEKEIEERKKKIINFLKQKTNLIVYSILAFIIFISAYIRTRNMSGLKDITTGTWTLGPDLDPFLFLRWAKTIAQNGGLFVLDTMRSVPLAQICSGTTCNPVNTATEMNLLSYMIVWLNKFLSFFSKEVTVTYSAVIFPVIFAVLTGIMFFIFTRKLFYKENKRVADIIALVSTAIFILVPSLLPRTIAGIPEKESAAFFFLFGAFYFFLEAYTSHKTKRGIIFSILAGIFTGILGLVWGGVTFAFIGISGAVLLAFLFEKMNKEKLLYYFCWIASAVIIMVPLSTRYTLDSLVGSSSTGLSFGVLFILIIDFIIFDRKFLKIDEKVKRIKLPKSLISIIVSLVIVMLLASIVFGASFIPNIVKDVISHTIEPFDQSRFGVTVAENKQPYFSSDWISEFGPTVVGIPLYFWLFFAGSVFLFYFMIKSLTKKEKRILVISYIIFLLGLVFSKYSSDSILNGESGLSLLVYFGGALIFLTSFGYVYYKRHKEDKLSIFSEFNFTYLFYFVILTMMIVAARGAVRLIMVLGAVSPIAIGFLITKSAEKYLHEKEETNKLLAGIAVILILIASLIMVWNYYQTDISTAESYSPGIYQWQWQKAMAWVRENTSLSAVFAHWWDYGYWVQSIGERATVLDGGNAVGYWNHLMGRLVLTGTNESEALNFLYAHNVTHLLIDSTDIGKYGAFSSIGSDANYDHYSWIPVITRDESQTVETSNETVYIYPVGTVIDQDIILNISGKSILLPRKSAGIAAVGVREDSNGTILQPQIYYVYNSIQYQMPLRYIYINNKLYDFKSGIEAGLFTFTRVDQDSTSGSLSIVPSGAGIYLSNKTINTELAQLYLFNQTSKYIKLAHSENDLLITNLRNQGANVDEFVYYQGLRGPIKIWEVSYPSGIKLNEDYLNTTYPAELETTISGEY